jgi:hypothetical protein
MTPMTRVTMLAWLGGAAVAFAAVTNEPPGITGFTVPFFDDQGEMTSRLHGDYARINPSNNIVQITGVRMETYKRTGTNRVTEMTITAPQCDFNRRNDTAFSDGPVRIAGSNMVVTGTGFGWDNRRQALRIDHDAQVVLKNARRDIKGADPAPAGGKP